MKDSEPCHHFNSWKRWDHSEVWDKDLIKSVLQLVSSISYIMFFRGKNPVFLFITYNQWYKVEYSIKHLFLE